MRHPRRTIVTSILAAILLVAPASMAGAHHMEDCHGEHAGLAHAHSTIPHHSPGNHKAHQSAPYCPPHDAPRHHHANGHGGM